MKEWNGEVWDIHNVWKGDLLPKGDADSRYVPYGDMSREERKDRDVVMIEVPCTTGSDYSGSDDVTKVNYLTLEEEYKEDTRFFFMYGGYGSYGVYVVVPVVEGVVYVPDDVQENVLDRLESYPLLDDDASEMMVVEEETAQWDSWIKGDFLGELLKGYEGDCNREGIEEVMEDWLDEVDNKRVWDLYRAACEKANVYFYCEEGSSWYVDLERAVGVIDRGMMVEWLKPGAGIRAWLKCWDVAGKMHGSGVDGKWSFEERKRNVRVKGSYHLLSEHGYYVRWIDFDVVVGKGKGERWRLDFHGEGGYWTGQVKGYLEDTVAGVIGG